MNRRPRREVSVALVLMAGAWAGGCDIESALLRTATPQADSLARVALEHSLAGDAAELRAMTHPMAGNLDAGVEQIRRAVADYELTEEPRLVGSAWELRGGVRYRSLNYEAALSTANPLLRLEGVDPEWLHASITVIEQAGEHRIGGVFVNLATQSLAATNSFAENMRPVQVTFLLLMAAAAAVHAVAIHRVVRSRMRRRWLWVMVTFIGTPRAILNWTTGALQVQLVSIHFPPIGFERVGVSGPWIVIVALPAGAFLVLDRVRRHRADLERQVCTEELLAAAIPDQLASSSSARPAT